MNRAALTALGVFSLPPTIVLFSLDILLSTHSQNASNSRAMPVASAVLAVLVLVTLSTLLATISPNRFFSLHRLHSSVLLAVLASVALLCSSLAAISVGCVVKASRASGNNTDTLAGIPKNTMIIVYSAMVGVSIISQLGFLAACTIFFRKDSSVVAEASETDSVSQPSLKATWRVKTVPYTSTRPSMADSRGKTSLDSTRMTSLRNCASPAPTCDSSRSSFSQIPRPSSKRRLLSLRELQQQVPLDCEVVRESIDTGAEQHPPLADQNQYSRLYQTFEAPRFLETIPASPVTGEPESGGLSDLSLPPPPPAVARQRSRSFSPHGSRLPPPPPLPRSESPRASTSADELHIHPLFRSDSPTPPPMVTPGTMVTASPDAGRVIKHHPSNQSLRRLRSGSQLSQHNPSPLRRTNSSETFGTGSKTPLDTCRSIREQVEAGERGAESDTGSDSGADTRGSNDGSLEEPSSRC